MRTVPPPPLDRPGLPRRRFLAGGLSLAALLAGCSTPAGPAAPATEGAPTRVPHKYGETEVPRDPQRVVTVGLTDHDYLLAFGVVPVGITDWYGDQPLGVWPWAVDRLGGAQPAVMPRNNDQIDFERVAALAPDLVVGQYCGMTQGDYDRLSAIAPTVAQSAAHPDYGMPWDETTRVVGRVLGRPDEAERLIGGVQDRFAAARAAHPELAGRSAVVAEQFEPNTYFVRSASDPRTRFLTSLGCVLPDDLAQLAGAMDGATISAEQVTLLDRDLVVWNAGFASELPARLRTDPLYPRLRVAREGRDVFVVDEPLSGALTWSTVLSLPVAIDQLAPKLAAAVDGDPTTSA